MDVHDRGGLQLLEAGTATLGKKFTYGAICLVQSFLSLCITRHFPRQLVCLLSLANDNATKNTEKENSTLLGEDIIAAKNRR